MTIILATNFLAKEAQKLKQPADAILEHVTFYVKTPLFGPLFIKTFGRTG